jgi:hypothetical protein
MALVMLERIVVPPTLRFVVVALVVVEFSITRFVIVEEAALTRIPPVKERRVEVEFPGKGSCPREALVM